MAGFDFYVCFVFATALCKRPCQNGGRCVSDPGICWCTSGFFGEACEFSKYKIVFFCIHVYSLFHLMVFLFYVSHFNKNTEYKVHVSYVLW